MELQGDDVQIETEVIDVDLLELVRDGIEYDKSLVGCEAKTWEELENVYKKHACVFGFACKRSTTRKYANGDVREKYLLCSCEGYSNIKPLVVITPSPPAPSLESQQGGKNLTRKRKRNCPIIRTGCKAKVIIAHNTDSNLFSIKEHEMFHNHPLTRTEWQHYHRSERNISTEKGETIEVMEAAGVKPTDGFRLMSKVAGGEEYVGHIKKDHINFVTKLRMHVVDGGDAQNVINALHDLKQKNPNFYFNYLLDDDGRLACLFWADALMILDYLLYGDVVVFDTTYRTNKYNLICAPFVGINNHWGTVLFACAFINNETTQTFVWLFKEFLEAMGNKKPTTIFTDQDAAIAAAIKQVFGNSTRHRLCLWHILQNAYNHCGEVKKNEEFKIAFKHCLGGCRTGEEFETCWQAMLVKFDVADHPWFHKIYDAREKWCTGLSTDFFSAGMLSSQRSESTNHAISFKANKTTTLTQFFQIFDCMKDSWRSTEKLLEFNTSRSKQNLKVFNLIVQHAEEVYTPTIFKYFQKEFLFSMGTRATEKTRVGDHVLYDVSREDEPTKIYSVCFSGENNKFVVQCSCKYFEEVGWLCLHCIRVLHLNNVTAIPSQYILARWTKEAKREVWDIIKEKKTTQSALPDSLSWRQKMIRDYVNTAIQCEGDIEARKILEDGASRVLIALQELRKRDAEEVPQATIQAVVQKKSKTRKTISAANVDPLRPVLDPPRITTKGRSVAIQSKYDRTTPIPADFFSGPPNEKLF